MTGNKREITMEVETIYWSCSCCGDGYHYIIHIPELDVTYSKNDQFGDKLSEEHDDFPKFVDRHFEAGDVILAFEKEGYTVKVVGYDYVREDHEDD